MRSHRGERVDRLSVMQTRLLLALRRLGVYQGDIDRLAGLAGLTVNHAWLSLVGLHELEHVSVGKTGTMLKVAETQSGRRARLALDHTRR